MGRSLERYKIFYTQTAVDDIDKLDPVSKKRIGKKIQALSKDPLSHARKLINSSLGYYRWRIGDYRIIFDLDGNRIIVLRVGHRKEIYR